MGEDDVAHRDGERAGFGVERLDEEEGVAARGGVEPGRVEEAVADQRANGVDRERGHLDPGHAGTGEGADGATDRVVVRHVVAVGGEDEAGERVEATGDESEEVEGGLVGPLQVFEHEHGGGRRRGQLGEDGVEHLGLVAARERVGERTGAVAGDVGERAERARGEEIVAAAEQHPTLGEVVVEQLLHESRLADAGLAADEHEVPAAIEVGEPLHHEGDLVSPFQQPHQRQGYDERAVGASGSGGPPVAGPVEPVVLRHLVISRAGCGRCGHSWRRRRPARRRRSSA